MQLKLSVHYPHGYPDELPELSLEPIQCDLEENERKDLLSEMQTIVRIHFGDIWLKPLIYPLLVKLGSRESGHGYDLHLSFASEGTVINVSTCPCGKPSECKEGRRTTGSRGIAHSLLYHNTSV